jgi:hypothetical protein
MIEDILAADACQDNCIRSCCNNPLFCILELSVLWSFNSHAELCISVAVLCSDLLRQ